MCLCVYVYSICVRACERRCQRTFLLDEHPTRDEKLPDLGEEHHGRRHERQRTGGHILFGRQTRQYRLDAITDSAKEEDKCLQRKKEVMERDMNNIQQTQWHDVMHVHIK